MVPIALGCRHINMNSSHKQVHVWAKMCVRGVSECLDRPTHRCKTYRQELHTVHSPEQPSFYQQKSIFCKGLADFPPQKRLNHSSKLKYRLYRSIYRSSHVTFNIKAKTKQSSLLLYILSCIDNVAPDYSDTFNFMGTFQIIFRAIMTEMINSTGSQNQQHTAW